MPKNMKNDKSKKQVAAMNYPDISKKIYICVDTEDYDEQKKELDRLRSEIADLNKRYDHSRLYAERLYEVALRKSILQMLKGIEHKKNQTEPTHVKLG